MLSIRLLFPRFVLLDNIELKTKYTRKDLEDNAEIFIKDNEYET